MAPNEVVLHVSRFLATARVKKLCRTYNAQPEEAMGELYIGLFKLAVDKQIKKPAAWISCNGTGLLRNWLRREARTLV
jgi:hypothetical protein